MPAGHPLYDYAIGLGIDQRQMARAIEKNQSVLRKTYTQAMGSAVDAAFSKRKLGQIEKSMSRASKEMHDTQLKLMILGKKMRMQGATEEQKLRMKGEMDILKARKKALREEARDRLKAAKEAAQAWQKETDKLQKAAMRRKAFTDKLSSGMGKGKGVGNFVQEMLSGLKGGDLGGLLKTGGGAAKKAGGGITKALGSKAGRKMGGGAALKMLGKLGGFMAKLGPILMAVGAIAGIFVALLKVIVDADAKMKEFRSSIIKSNVSALDLGADMYNLTDAVDEAVNSFAGLGKGLAFQYEWGVSAKEALQVVDAYAQAGVRVTEFTSGLKKAEDRQEALRESTAAALTYANLLGMQGNEVAQKMGEMMGNLNLSLAGVRMQFSGLTQIASQSAYSTKKFFSQVLQATSGMSMYNVRLEETGVLLQNLQKALGAKDGFEMLQKLLSGISGKGMKDRMKDTQVAAGGLAAGEEAAHRAMAARMEDFLQTGGKGFRAALRAAADELKLNISTTSGKALYDTLRKLKLSDRQRLLGAAANYTAGDPSAEKGVANLTDLLQHLDIGKGSVLQRRAALAGSEDALGPMYAFNKMNRMITTALSKGKGSRAIATMIAEEFGMDIKTSRNVFKMRDRLEGGLKYLTERLEGKSKGEIGDDEAARYQKAFGVTPVWAEELGKYVLRAGGKDGPIVKDMQGMMEANRDMFNKMIAEGKEKEDIALARQIAGATTEATKILSGMADGVLTNIFGYVQSIFSWMTKSDKQYGSEAAKMLRADLSNKREEASSRVRTASAHIQRIEALKKEASPEDLDILNTELAKWKDVKSEHQGTVAGLDKMRMSLDTKLATDPKWAETIFKGSERVFSGGEEEKAIARSTMFKRLASDAGVRGGYYGAAGADEKEKTLWVAGLKSQKQTATLTARTNEKLDKIEERLKKNNDALINDLRAKAAAGDIAAGASLAGVTKGLTTPTVESIARQVMAGRISPELLASLKDHPELAKYLVGRPEVPTAIADEIRKAAGINDGIIRVGKRDLQVTRVNENDVMEFRKGGRTGGGSGPVNVVNNFWEGKGAFNSVRQLEKAKGRFA